jgi:hypothetical protein
VIMPLKVTTSKTRSDKLNRTLQGNNKTRPINIRMNPWWTDGRLKITTLASENAPISDYKEDPIRLVQMVDLNHIRHVQKYVAKHQLSQVTNYEPNQTNQCNDRSMVEKWQIESQQHNTLLCCYALCMPPVCQLCNMPLTYHFVICHF